MKTIILPGYSLNNKDWADEVKSYLKPDTEDSILVHEWRHWTSGNFSLKYELEKLLEEAGGNEVNIIAKSVGTLVAMKLLQKMKARIKKIILCGIPSTSVVRKNIFLESLKDYDPENIICFQNRKDPFAQYREVKEFMQGVEPKIKVFEKPRNDHNYPFFEDFRIFLAG